MITAIIENKGNTLVTEFPVANYRLSEQLYCIGITERIGDIPVRGDSDTKVELLDDGKMGAAILKRLTDSDTLTGLNMACQAVAKAAPYGYEEILGMFEPELSERYEFYKKFEPLPPSTELGVKGILEDTQRYCATMDNYRRVCEAEQQEDEELDEEFDEALDEELDEEDGWEM